MAESITETIARAVFRAGLHPSGNRAIVQGGSVITVLPLNKRRKAKR